jgi:hypothetical protein
VRISGRGRPRGDPRGSRREGREAADVDLAAEHRARGRWAIAERDELIRRQAGAVHGRDRRLGQAIETAEDSVEGAQHPAHALARVVAHVHAREDPRDRGAQHDRLEIGPIGERREDGVQAWIVAMSRTLTGGRSR